MSFSRRTLLGASAAGLGAAALGMTPPQRGRGRRPKNIIFCVVDGLSTATLTMSDHFQQLRDGKRSYWSTLLEKEGVVRAWQDTRSLNSVVTDSSAASSTWGSGRRIWNGQVNMYPDGTELRTLTSLMSEAGVRCGLVTTTTISHATPAGFAVNAMNRGQEPLICERYLKAGVDVIMGGGDDNLNPKKRKDGKDLYADFERAGFKVFRERSQVLGAKANKILGVFGPSHLPYTIDRDNDPELARVTPTLAEMAKVAIDNLKGSKNGFLLQIEGGKVDHAAHGNDFGAMIYDQIAFEEAVRVAIEFAEKDGETLVIITADHATGGPTLNGAGQEYFDSTAGLLTAAGMKASYGPVFSALGKTPSADDVQGVIETKLGIKLSKEEAEGVVAGIGGKSPFRLSQFHGSSGATLAMLLGNHSKVQWTSGNHTSDHVVVTAWGPGSDRVVGLTPNVKFFDIMLGLKGLKWSNPTMSFEEAQRHYAKLRASLEPEILAEWGVHDGEFTI
ncbi:MAG: alkaline phosphatase [Fimbriimonas sp.]